jgi:hypothetical protein
MEHRLILLDLPLRPVGEDLLHLVDDRRDAAQRRRGVEVARLVGKEVAAAHLGRNVALADVVAQRGRVLGIALHPFLIGAPHRIRYLDHALSHIVSHDKGVRIAAPRRVRGAK